MTHGDRVEEVLEVRTGVIRPEGSFSEGVDQGPPLTDLGCEGVLPTLEEQNQDSIVSDGIPVIESGPHSKSCLAVKSHT